MYLWCLTASSVLKKSPCLLRSMCSSSSVIFSSHHFSLSALVALLTCLHKVRYSCHRSTFVHCSCHCTNFWRFFSTSTIVSTESHCHCGCLLLCRCFSAHSTTASLSSFRTASALSSFLPLKHFLTSSMYSTHLSGCLRHCTSNIFPFLYLSFFASFSLNKAITNQWSLSMFDPLYPRASTIAGISSDLAELWVWWIPGCLLDGCTCVGTDCW